MHVDIDGCDLRRLCSPMLILHWFRTYTWLDIVGCCMFLGSFCFMSGWGGRLTVGNIPQHVNNIHVKYVLICVYVSLLFCQVVVKFIFTICWRMVTVYVCC